ncbi:TetR/AcrR family transcriptional regulator [Novosphingobium album (ex Liu et al. 2023)]|uniref:TetR/AcrR family transcriptional regulator n=1 Tax=Novosphingobium album (ex Liu et al. 2023) TaxID=3031130 RepID=A0ABT5WMD3_9SPHN|nr:TetR/AcrR family transcriptional regulator [Novosphingobium album (ex Liu et al. 2023)]MDE8651200.1 TetR/AcrR family transcriptional regulator [Novosphingobium album (ex Liu et al. 2023)]
MKATAQTPAAPRRPHSSKIGRPTREEADIRHEELLDASVDLFLEYGYDGATLERIASSVGMTKRTIYSRHEDKAALFKATVQRAIERLTADQDEKLRSLAAAELELALVEVARMRVRQVTSPIGVKLQRLVNAEAFRFPEIFVAAAEQVTRPVVAALAALLLRDAEKGLIVAGRPEMAATAFMSMVVGGPARVVASGNPVDEAEMEDRIAYSVRLLLDGLRPRD